MISKTLTQHHEKVNNKTSEKKNMHVLRQPSFTILHLLISISVVVAAIAPNSLLCRTFCGTIPINYPFGLDDGCGAQQYQKMLNCNTSTNNNSNSNSNSNSSSSSSSTSTTTSLDSLFFQTPSGSYKVQSIDYDKKTLSIYDPSMSTCSILQPHHDFVMTDVQYAIVPPSPDTIFVLLNCSIDSPVLNHYQSLCFNFSDHSCDELYGGCNAFRLFHLLSNSTPPCCFTGYNTVKFMSMNILDCSHYTTVYDTDNLKGITPLDWTYGIKLSYSVPDTGCERCVKSGGTCGFDTETEGMLCLCSSSMNSTRQCAAGSFTGGGVSHTATKSFQAFALVIGAFVYMIFT